MKKHFFPRFLTLLLVLMTLSVCASAIEIKLYDNGELSNTLTSAIIFRNCTYINDFF